MDFVRYKRLTYTIEDEDNLGGGRLEQMASKQYSQFISGEINYCEEIKKLRVKLNCLWKRVQELKANNNQGFEKDVSSPVI